MAIVRLHHLSDLHIGVGEHQPPATPFPIPIVKRWEWYLKFLNQPDLRLPLAVIVSGDLTSKGAVEEFNEAKNFIATLSKLLQDKHRDGRPHVCVVPGNHDLDRRNGKTFEAMIQCFKETFSGSQGVVTAFCPNPYLHFEKENVLICLVNTCRLGSQLDRPLHAIDQLLSALLDNAELPNDSPLAQLRRRTIHDPGYVAPSDLDYLGNLRDRVHTMKIAVLHHNLGTVPEESLDAYHTVINSGFVKQRLQEEGIDVVLSGHRHALHCAYEEHWGARLGGDSIGLGPPNLDFPRHEGVYYLTAPTFSSRDGAGHGPSWMEIAIDSTGGSHQGKPPSSLVTVTAANPAPQKLSFTLEDAARFRFPVDKPVYAKWRFIQERLERDVVRAEDISRTRTALETFWLPLLNLQGRLDDWDREDDNWQELFHDRLPTYRFIYGIDLLGPETWLNPRYLLYVLKQFETRQANHGDHPDAFHFSSELHAATTRTKWSPDLSLNAGNGRSGIEIARILIWKRSQVTSAAQCDILRMIDSLHRLFCVPLFLLDPVEAELDGNILSDEFVLGLGDSGVVNRAYVYRLGATKTKEAKGAEGQKLLSRFYAFLQSDALRTANDFLEKQAVT
jgi:predicted MPP superfamily phosphohydrolase